MQHLQRLGDGQILVLPFSSAGTVPRATLTRDEVTARVFLPGDVILRQGDRVTKQTDALFILNAGLAVVEDAQTVRGGQWEERSLEAKPLPACARAACRSFLDVEDCCAHTPCARLLQAARSLCVCVGASWYSHESLEKRGSPQLTFGECYAGVP